MSGATITRPECLQGYDCFTIRRSFTKSNHIFDKKTCGGSTGEKPKIASPQGTRGCMEFPKPFVETLREAQAQLAERGANPWRRALERDLPANVTCISTVALLDLLGLAPTTGNARRIASTMRSMGFIGLKSRRLMPGGNRGTTIRGWARPFLEPKKSTPSMKPADAAVGACASQSRGAAA
jgi:hypothetical protein